MISPTLPPSYENWQIGGFIDALRNSTPAGQARIGVPAIIFMTTSNVVTPGLRSRMLANSQQYRVALIHSIACEIGSTGSLQMGSPSYVNPIVYLLYGTIPATLPFGTPSNLPQ